LKRTNARARSGDHARAEVDANELAKDESASSDAFYDLACIFSLSAAAAAKDTKLPEPERDKLPDKYAARAVELLAKAGASGHFKDPARVEHLKKDSDLDPLRTREDYKKLLANLESN
jgi:hypothetical protein